MNNTAFRVAISKIRLSSHLFFVERGRWGQNSVERKDRLCSYCKCVEDEFHVLVRCPIFDNEREGLIPDFLRLDQNTANFIRYLNSSNQEEQKKLGLLCYRIQKEYKKML